MKNSMQKANTFLSVLQSIENVMGRINKVVATACGIILFLFMFMVVSDVTGRFLFSKPVPATTEVGSTVLAFVIFMGLAITMARNQHVRVEILVGRLPRSWQFWLELFALVLCFAVVFSMVWYGLPFLIASIKIREAYPTWGVPLYLAKAALFFGTLLFAIQILIVFAKLLTSRLIPIPVNSQENVKSPSAM
jgi:TRAP-type C4-dicarboxylate transport system permease small subunit